MSKHEAYDQGYLVGSRGSAPMQADTLGQPIATNLLFGVTVDDIAALPEEEFKAVWDALGKVARARARATQRSAAEPDTEDVGQ